MRKISVRDVWLSGQGGLSEDEQAVEAVRDYVQRFRGQMFVNGSGRGQAQLPNNCHGIVRGDQLLLTDANFRDACGGLDPRLVACALDDAGVLHRHDDQYKAKVSVAELRINKVRFYVLMMDRLFQGQEADAETSANDDTE